VLSLFGGMQASMPHAAQAQLDLQQQAQSDGRMQGTQDSGIEQCTAGRSSPQAAGPVGIAGHAIQPQLQRTPSTTSPKGGSVLLAPHWQGAVVLAPRVASVPVAVGLKAAGKMQGQGGAASKQQARARGERLHCPWQPACGAERTAQRSRRSGEACSAARCSAARRGSPWVPPLLEVAV